MASSPDRYGNFMGFGVLERNHNVLFVLGLDYQRWVHVVIYFVARRRILVVVILICLCSLYELIACYASDSSHDVGVRPE